MSCDWEEFVNSGIEGEDYCNQKEYYPSFNPQISLIGAQDNHFKPYRDYSNYTPFCNYPGELENRIIQIDGLNPETTEEDLKNYCKELNIQDDGISKVTIDISKCRAYITFFDLRNAILFRSKINGHVIKRHALRGRYAPFPKVEYSRSPPNEGTIVIFHLPENITQNDLVHQFGAFGDIKQIRDSPKNRSQKFIEYFDIKAAESAKETTNGQFYGKNRLIVDFSLPGGFRKVHNPYKNQNIREVLITRAK